MGEELGITVGKDEDIAEWYQQIVVKGEFADYTPVKGMIAYRPNGFRIWELIMENFDRELKNHGVDNTSFPLLIPEHMLTKEAEHFQGFTPEVFWTTMGGETKLEERLAIRPTSETIIHTMMGRWIQSYRDLPMRFNQWNTVYRYETKMTKPFIRGREILWKETHTVHASREEAEKETKWAIDMYKRMIEGLAALPVVYGKKTESDKFAGAEYTYTIELFMPDGKALQTGTSHLLSQKFSNAFDVKFLDENEKWKYAWMTSYGQAMRLIGAVLMAHGDDKGAIIPPEIAAHQAVIVPILFKGKEKPVVEACRKLEKEMKRAGIRVKFDDREGYTAGWKFNHWELKGVPLRIEIGPRDVKAKKFVLVRRDNGKKTDGKTTADIKKILKTIQKDMFEKQKELLENAVEKAEEPKAIKRLIKSGKWASIPHCGETSCEEKITEESGGEPRVIPFKQESTKGHQCAGCGKGAKYWLYWGKSY